MAKHYIGFFCGTGYTTERDASLKAIKATVTSSNTTILAYDGCQIHGGGLFAHGVEEQAQNFVKDLKTNLENLPDGEMTQVNLVAHSRGCLSAMLAIKMIQADPELKGKINITVDFRDPVPGNFQTSTKLNSNLFIANQAYDLSDCDVVQKASITLQEEPIGPLAFDALVPKFHPETKIEIETLPGIHDIQQRNSNCWVVNEKGKDVHYQDYLQEKHGDKKGVFIYQAGVQLLTLGTAKTLSILQDDKHSLRGQTERSLVTTQRNAYHSLARLANDYEEPFRVRDLHFGGNLIANNTGNKRIDAVNWRHAQLEHKYNGAKFIPEHVLFGMTQPHYNHRKSDQERYCDLTMTLDLYVQKNPQQQEFVNELLKASKEYYQNDNKNVTEYSATCKKILEKYSVHNKAIYQAINSMCLNEYFKPLQDKIDAIPKDNQLHQHLVNLKEELMVELDSEIRNGKTLAQIAHSNPLKIAENTIEFMDKIYDKNNPLTLDDFVKAADEYTDKSIRYGRNWNAGSKVIVGLILGVASAAVGCAVGAAIGLGLGFATGAITGPGALVTAIVGAFVGGFQGAMIAATATGAAVGIGIGASRANMFFRPSDSEKQVQSVVKTVKDMKEELGALKKPSSLDDDEVDNNNSSSATI
ncbi:MAG: hypothetical protein LEGION0403_FIIPPAGN_02517 [Legionella sp.]|uniref:hypothetical protein n=1 Tax=Legionella sp. TaxID=459 RepID=UPI003D1195CC